MLYLLEIKPRQYSLLHGISSAKLPNCVQYYHAAWIQP